MFTKLRYPILLLFIFLTIGGVYFSTAYAGDDSYSYKVAALNDELRGYDAIKRPNIRYDACIKINNALFAVLQDKESLAAEPGEIIGDGSGFTLNFGDWADADGKKYRLAVLIPKEVDMGAITTVFSQSTDGAAVTVAQVHSLTQASIAGSLEYSAITASGDGYFLLLIEKKHGPEHKYISFYTQKLENGKWQPAALSPTVTAQGRWTIEGHSLGFSISHTAMGWKSPYDYQLNTGNGYFAIEIVDKNAKPLDRIRLDFVAGKWIIR